VMAEWQKKDTRIRYVRSEHRGIPQTYNQGLKLGTGHYFAMADDDDPWADVHKLEKQVAFLDAHSDIVACGSGMIVVDGAGKELYRFLKPETDAIIRDKLLFANPMANATTLFRRDATEKIGWYDETLPHASDWDFWLRMGKVGMLCNAQEYYSYYTFNEKNTSYLHERENLNMAFRVVKKYRNDYPHYRLAVLFHYLQKAYALLPRPIRRVSHGFLRRIKQLAMQS